jgi:hypothetical protein
MERFCGLLANSCKSRRYPYTSLSHCICDMAQLNQIKILYDLEKELDLDSQSGVTGQLYDECKYSPNDMISGAYN